MDVIIKLEKELERKIILIKIVVNAKPEPILLHMFVLAYLVPLATNNLIVKLNIHCHTSSHTPIAGLWFKWG